MYANKSAELRQNAIKMQIICTIQKKAVNSDAACPTGIPPKVRSRPAGHMQFFGTPLPIVTNVTRVGSLRKSKGDIEQGIRKNFSYGITPCVYECYFPFLC